MDIEKIANLIKMKRKEKNLTQEELARKLNVTEKAISRWETGRGTPDISLLLPLANILGVTVSEILSGKEDKKSNESLKEIIEYIDVSKSKKNIKFFILSIAIYVCTLLLYLGYLKFEYTPNFSFSYAQEVIYNLFFAAFILAANKIIANQYYDRVEDKEKMKKITYVLLFLLYTILVLNLTIFGRFGNAGIRYNLVPFKTIMDYFIHFHTFNLDIIFINILGNIVVFMPIQYFILKIGNFKKFSSVFILSFFFVFFIELLQLVTQTGIFDVDDMILNLFGMFLVYFVMCNFVKKKKIDRD